MPMARKLRVEYPGAVYDVMNRGDRREAIFRDDVDRRRFVSTLGEGCGIITFIWWWKPRGEIWWRG